MHRDMSTIYEIAKCSMMSYVVDHLLFSASFLSVSLSAYTSASFFLSVTLYISASFFLSMSCSLPIFLCCSFSLCRSLPVFLCHSLPVFLCHVIQQGIKRSCQQAHTCSPTSCCKQEPKTNDTDSS